ncbi:hypothetical protein [Nocardia bovistercoris]|uniref:Uncharacterized protein n=1 Tax=Nocardia bovistercoris TaxID=2785916 RepID=A0A931I6M9_9NOCA|nr:hypothetical protein [Nocardia bovistercoris]MBH0775887.1 hypothetical protein [Nocardia bovistercoris]
MFWQRSSEVAETAHVGIIVSERSAPDWMMVISVVFGAVIAVALIVLLLVSNADFDTGPPKAPPPSGTCEPFCGAAQPAP